MTYLLDKLTHNNTISVKSTLALVNNIKRNVFSIQSDIPLETEPFWLQWIETKSQWPTTIITHYAFVKMTNDKEAILVDNGYLPSKIQTNNNMSDDVRFSLPCIMSGFTKRIGPSEIGFDMNFPMVENFYYIRIKGKRLWWNPKWNEKLDFFGKEFFKSDIDKCAYLGYKGNIESLFRN